MWTTETIHSADCTRVRLSDGKISIELESKEYLDLVAALRLRLGEIDAVQYHQQIRPAWRAQPIELFDDILTLNPEAPQSFLLCVRRGGSVMEHGISRVEAAELLADSQRLIEL